MAMTLPLSPASGNSPTSDVDIPPTPVSPGPHHQDSSTQQQNIQANSPSSPTNPASAQAKRKPSRRANTAERRATHNAVERQRRETLNSRFLDLAALLPNLSQIRRPSKSSIVNSSIAHIHASRRHRMLAARELRVLKHEVDALRREINEWRDRAGIPRVEEPVRSDAFSMILSGELEVIAAVPGDEDPEEDGDYIGYDDDYPTAVATQAPPPQPQQQQQQPHSHGMSHGVHHAAAAGGGGHHHPHMDDLDDPRMASMIKAGHPFAHNIPPGPNGNSLHLAHILPRPSPGGGGASMVGSPTAFDGPNMYDSHHAFGGSGPGGFMSQQQQQQHAMEAEKMGAWYGAAQSQQQMMQQAQRSLFTPPASSHGLPGGGGSGNNNNNNNGGCASPVNGNPSASSTANGNGSKPPSPAMTTNPFSDPSSQAFFAANMPRHHPHHHQQQQHPHQHQHQQGYISDEAGSSSGSGKRMSVPVPINIQQGGRGRALSTASLGMSVSPGSGGSPISTGAGSVVGSPYEVVVDGGRRQGGVPNGWRDEVQHGHNLMGMGVGAGGAGAGAGGMMMNGMVGGMGGMVVGNGLVGNAMGTMVSVGGGGSGGGFAMMM